MMERMMSSIDVVKTFIESWSRLDIIAIQAAVTDDIFYQNIPFAAVEKLDELQAFGDSVTAMATAGVEGLPITPIIGRPAFTTFLQTVKQFDWADWKVKSIAADGDIVFTDRTDIFGFQGGGSIAVNVIGLFAVRNGQICSWKDFFRLHEFQSQLK
jgi:limonene-1,2-epoxide hydrolase